MLNFSLDTMSKNPAAELIAAYPVFSGVVLGALIVALAVSIGKRKARKPTSNTPWNTHQLDNDTIEGLPKSMLSALGMQGVLLIPAQNIVRLRTATA